MMETKPKLRKIGNSDLQVSPVGLGCWQFSRGKGIIGNYWRTIDEQDIKEIIKVSMRGGINWFDTAEAYGWGASEQTLAKTLVELNTSPKDVITATKWMPIFRTAGSLLKTIHKRLEALKPYPIDLYQIHQPYSLSSVSAQMEQLARLMDQGKIRYAGVSNFSAKSMRIAHKELKKHGYSLVANQVKYHLLYRNIERNDILETARELGITIIAYSPLAQGILSGKYHRNLELLNKISRLRKYIGGFKIKELEKSKAIIDLLQKLSEKYQATPAQMALNWLIHIAGDSVVAIPGAVTVQQAQENAGAMNFTLHKEDMAAIDEATRGFK
jgi:aryl-alcohol dehydrogenase-like predicted oxidoreductase